MVRVNCFFLRKELDWHVLPNGLICYVLQHQWEREMSRFFQRDHSMDNVVGFAAGWCLSALDSLLVRHLIGYRLGLQKWPAEWSAWKHGSEGVEQYEEESREK
jgi:hypothetical protein